MIFSGVKVTRWILLVSASTAACTSASSPKSNPDAGAVTSPPHEAPAPANVARDGEAPPPDANVVDGGLPDAKVDARDPSIPSSAGVGGLPCSRHDDLGGGRTSCVAKVGIVELRIVAGASAGAAPMRLGLFLHGDGAQYHLDNSVLTAMLPWADAHHGIVVSALAPNGCSWWLAPSYDCSGSQTPSDSAAANSAALAAALAALMGAYDLRTDGIDYYSASGGSIFVAEQWLPLEGGTYPGVFAVMCGGAVTSRAYAWNTGDAALRAKSAFWFTYGSNDGLRPDIEATIADLSAKGLAVTPKVIANEGHCTFDERGEALAIWSSAP
jgi:hypothetical protein